MPQPEFLAWLEFYKLNPFDDYARFYRPAALIVNAMNGADVNDSLAWLEHRQTADYSDADLATMKAFGMKPPRKT